VLGDQALLLPENIQLAESFNQSNPYVGFVWYLVWLYEARPPARERSQGGCRLE
jgi:hypothetical protein